MSERRFWAKANVLGTDNCWEWQGRKSYNGYGRCWFRGKVKRAHRIAYELELGEIPDDMLVCHRCDNPGCVNPAHLFLGTHRDNTLDMVAKGRWDHGRRKDAATVALAKFLMRLGNTTHVVADWLGVSKSATGEWRLDM